MSVFETTRDRDAYGAIRGYKYQIDLTIVRWLELEDSEILELERGEDIDRITNSLVAAEETSRTLEQVKHLVSPITLKTPGCIAALANALEHRRTNPSLKLLFRFTTNAPSTLERPSPFRPRQPAINVWEFLRSDAIQSYDHLLRGIRTILSGTQRPNNVPSEIWQPFKTFVLNCTNQELYRFIADFEWGTGEAGIEELEPKITSKLNDGGFAASAGLIYKALFLSVVTLLSQPGIKRLDRQILKQHLEHPQIGDKHAGLMRHLEERVFGLERRMETIEILVQEQGEKIVEVLNTQQNLDGRLGMHVAPLDFELPQTVAHAAYRPETVRTLVELTHGVNWLALYGGIGSGKTELAKLIAAAKVDAASYFLPFRDRSADEIEFTLLQFVRHLAKSPLDLDRASTIQAAARNLPSKTIVVWDDLPRIIPGSGLCRFIIDWCRASRVAGHYLLTTSYYAPPADVLAQLPDSVRMSRLVPAFTDDEAKELLVAAGMPLDTAFSSSTLAMLNASAGGHPTLLAALARVLSKRAWEIPPDKLQDIIRTGTITQVDDQIMPRLLETVTDTIDRQLLYRLALVQGSFAPATALSIAHTHTPLDRPRERLSRLAGPWIQAQRTESLIVSPLIRPLADSELPLAERKAVFTCLAENIVSSRIWTVLDVGKAVSYLFAAESFERAGTLLLVALSNSRQLPEEQLRLLLLISRPNDSLPAGISLGVRLYLRGLQIKACEQLKLSTDYLFAESDTLLVNGLETDAWAVVGFVVNTLFVRAARDFARALLDISLAGRALPRATAGDGLNRVPTDSKPSTLLWLVAPNIRSVADLTKWLDAVELLAPEGFPKTLSRANGSFNTGNLSMNSVWMQEFEKDPTARDWASVERILRRAVEVGVRLNFEPLFGAAAKGLIIVLADYLKSLSSAENFAEEVLLAVRTSEAKLLITEGMGRQYFYQSQYPAAEKWLRRAITIDSPSLRHIQAEARVCLSAVVAEKDASEALKLVEEAALLVLSNGSDIVSVIKVTTLAELAMARGFANDFHGSFSAYDEAATELLAPQERSEVWRSLAVLFGHLGGYLTHIVRGSEPESTEEGEPYGRPYRGMFLTAYTKARAAWYDETRAALLPSLLCTFAEEVGDDVRAESWAIRGIDEARRRGNMATIQSLAGNLIPYLIKQRNFVEAFDAAKEMAEASMAAHILRERGQTVFITGQDSAAILETASVKERIFVDRMAASMGGVSIAFGLASVLLTEPDSVERHAKVTVEFCRTAATVAVDSAVWNKLASAIDAGFGRRLPMEDLNVLANEAAREGERPAHLVGYLAMSVADNASLQVSAVAQAVVMHGVESVLGVDSSLYRTTVIPFISGFWDRAIKTQRFGFTAPNLVEHELASAATGPASQKVRKILKSVLRGVGGTLPDNADETRLWLDKN